MTERKRVKISSSRQFSIPKEYYNALGMGDEAIVELHENRLVIRPAPKDDPDDNYFTEFIYQDVINEGFEGSDIMKEVNKRKKKIKPAIDAFIEDARKNAKPFDLDSLFDDDGDE